MKATKYKLDIEIECLSKDCFVGLLSTVIDGLLEEVDSGALNYDDGDSVSWSVGKKEVTF